MLANYSKPEALRNHLIGLCDREGIPLASNADASPQPLMTLGWELQTHA